MIVNTKKSRFRHLIGMIPVVFIFSAGCGDKTGNLLLADLNDAELVYLTRYVTIERARAVYAIDPELGAGLLDSLATTWGDSNAVEIQRRLPSDMPRLAQVNKLLIRILEAEEDSLVLAARPDRLNTPITDPPPLQP